MGSITWEIQGKEQPDEADFGRRNEDAEEDKENGLTK